MVLSRTTAFVDGEKIYFKFLTIIYYGRSKQEAVFFRCNVCSFDFRQTLTLSRYLAPRCGSEDTGRV